jgi:DNA-binding transcriptional ArsR family regulator
VISEAVAGVREFEIRSWHLSIPRTSQFQNSKPDPNSLDVGERGSYKRIRISESEVMMVDARLFQALSDATRLKIVSLLARGSMNVSRMVAELGCAQPAVSRHLRVLREVDLIHHTRHGKEVEYSLNHERMGEAAAYLEGLAGAVPVGAGVPTGGGRESTAKPLRERGAGGAARSSGKRGRQKKAVGDGTQTLPGSGGEVERSGEPEYAIERRDDDGMDDFLL